MAVVQKKLAEMTLDGLSVGERIKSLRGDLSQVAFAKVLGISSKTLIRYESGERLPDVELLVKLNHLSNVQPIWLLTGAHEPLSGGLSKNETFLLNTFRSADDLTQRALLTIFNRLAELHFIGQQSKQSGAGKRPSEKNG